MSCHTPEPGSWHVIRGGVFIILETRRLGHIQRPDITMVFTNRAEQCIMFPSCCHLLIPNPPETMSLTLINSLIESSRPRRPVTECHACVTRRCHEVRRARELHLWCLYYFPFIFMFLRVCENSAAGMFCTLNTKNLNLLVLSIQIKIPCMEPSSINWIRITKHFKLSDCISMLSDLMRSVESGPTGH